MLLLLDLAKDPKLDKPESCSSPLERYVAQRGSETLRRFLNYEPLKMELELGDDFEPIIAVIDVEKKFGTADRLSQVYSHALIENIFAYCKCYI